MTPSFIAKPRERDDRERERERRLRERTQSNDLAACSRACRFSKAKRASRVANLLATFTLPLIGCPSPTFSLLSSSYDSRERRIARANRDTLQLEKEKLSRVSQKKKKEQNRHVVRSVLKLKVEPRQQMGNRSELRSVSTQVNQVLVVSEREEPCREREKRVDSPDCVVVELKEREGDQFHVARHREYLFFVTTGRGSVRNLLRRRTPGPGRGTTHGLVAVE